MLLYCIIQVNAQIQIDVIFILHLSLFVFVIWKASLSCWWRCWWVPSLRVTEDRARKCIFLLWKYLVWEGYPTLWNKNGVSFPTFNYFWDLSFEKFANIFSPPPPPPHDTISLCQTPMVINPSVIFIITKISRLGGYPIHWNNNGGIVHTTFNNFWALSFEKIAQNVLPTPTRYATISLIQDSEGHKPKRNENNSCGVLIRNNTINCSL